jgi:hypothetical protein
MSTTSNTISQQAFVFVLRKVLLLDAATCVMMGILLVAGKNVLTSLLGLPESFIGYSGWLLFPCAALIAFTGRVGSANNPPRALVWLVIFGNIGWIAASLLAVTVWFHPTAFGAVFVLFQAAAVVVLTALEIRGLNK